MSVLVTIGLVILGIICLVLLTLGLAVAFGVLLIGGLLIGAAYLIFGGGSFFNVFSGHSASQKVPQEFNRCLLGDDLEKCRKEFTAWKPEEMEVIRQLAKQVREEMGERLEDTTQSSSFQQNSVNGESTVTIEQETDFAKKKSVHEHYVLVSDPKSDTMKIKDLNWDYGEAPAVQTPKLP